MFGFLRKRIERCLRESIRPTLVEEMRVQMEYALRRQTLMQSALHCQEMGIEETHESRNKDIEETGGHKTQLIVSLTTHGERLYEVWLAIESIMQGTVKPSAIVLWLGENEPEEMPISLRRQMKRGLTIRRTRDIRSYTKLVPALQHYPEADIVTIDDDILYPPDFLENLLLMHRLHPQAIVANKVMRLRRAQDGVPEGIREWPYTLETNGERDADLFFEGFGGVLYPAHSMPKEALNEDVFSTISPTNDDAWFNAMARLAHCPIVPCNVHPYDYIAAVNPNVQSTALYHTNNTAENLNDKQIRNIWEHYRLQGQ